MSRGWALVGKKPEVSQSEIKCLIPKTEASILANIATSSTGDVDGAFLKLHEDNIGDIDTLIQMVLAQFSNNHPTPATHNCSPPTAQVAGEESSPGETPTVTNPNSTLLNESACPKDSPPTSPIVSANESSTLSRPHIGFFDMEYFSSPPRAWQIAILLPYAGKSYCSFINIDPLTTSKADISSLQHIGMEQGTWELLMNRSPPPQRVSAEIQSFFSQFHSLPLYHFQGNDAQQLSLLLKNNNNNDMHPNVTLHDIGHPIKSFVQGTETEGAAKKKKSCSLKALHLELPTEESLFKKLKCTASDHDARVDVVKLVEISKHWMSKFSLSQDVPVVETEQWAVQQLSGLVEQHEGKKKNKKRKRACDPSADEEEDPTPKTPRALDASRAEKIKVFLVSNHIDVLKRVLKRHLTEFLERTAHRNRRVQQLLRNSPH